MRNYYLARRESGAGWVFKALSATGWLIFVNVLVFVAFFIMQYLNSESVNYFALQASNILRGKYLWTLATHMFVHANVFHLLVNMFVLFSLGSLCEKIIGKKRFLWFYLITGVFAGLLSVVLAGFFGFGFLEKVFGSPEVFMVGASGAIFAIAGLFVVLLPRLRFTIIFLPFFSLPAYIMVPLVLLLTWLATLAANLPVGNVAHLGGFLAGIIYGYYLRMKYKKKIMIIQRLFR